MLVIALPYTADAAEAVKRARTGTLRRVNLNALTIDALQTLEFADAVEVVGDKNALDLLRPRNRILFCNVGAAE